MRWPFGPPQLTLTPPPTNKKKKSRKQKTKIKNNKNKTRTTPRTIERQTRKKTRSTKTTKTPKPSKPKWTRMSHPTKAPIPIKKHFQHFCNFTRHTKTNHNNIKPCKKQTKKHHFAMFKNNPLVFANCLFFFDMQLFYCNCCVCWKHYKIVFSESTPFQKHS